MSEIENNGRPWAYSAFRARVVGRRTLSPRFLRLTLAGDDFRNFAPWGLDQRIKLVLPLPDGSIADVGLLDDPTPHPSHWYARWRALPEAERNVLRTYTPAAIRPERGEIDVDVVLHEPPGPASLWALQAREGDELVVTGPDIRAGSTGYGLAWQPGSASAFLLVGDETAFPAIRNILSSLDAGVRATVLLEVDDVADDLLSPLARTGVAVRRLLRDRQPGEGLEAEVRRWAAEQRRSSVGTGAKAVDAEDIYVWLAGESSVVARIRRVLTHDVGLPKERVSFSGYWRLGGSL